MEQTYRHRQGVLPDLVQACQNLFLLVDPAQNQPDQPPASRLAHDTLVPHVRKRFDESDAPGQRARRILESRAVDWEEGKEGAPLDDADLTLVEAGENGMRARNPDEARLVQASVAARDQRLEERHRINLERAEAQQRELKQAQELAETQRLRAEEGEKAARHQLPDLFGLPLDGAQKRLEDLCQPAPCLDTRLRWKTSGQVARGSIMRSDPGATARLHWGTPVTLTVSMGPSEAIDDLTNIDLVNVPAGEFIMGSDPARDPESKPDEQPQFVGYLPDFSIGRNEITNAQYAVFAQAPGNTVRSPWLGDRVPQGKERHPVVDVSWYDAVRYTQWLSDLTDKPYRLSTEAEWEKACRGAAGQLFPWGNDFNSVCLPNRNMFKRRRQTNCSHSAVEMVSDGSLDSCILQDRQEIRVHLTVRSIDV